MTEKPTRSHSVRHLSRSRLLPYSKKSSVVLLYDERFFVFKRSRPTSSSFFAMHLFPSAREGRSSNLADNVEINTASYSGHIDIQITNQKALKKQNISPNTQSPGIVIFQSALYSFLTQTLLYLNNFMFGVPFNHLFCFLIFRNIKLFCYDISFVI